ncbi:hypothetical protein NPIL_601141 [Nephila pilipes]|uniref:Uncharacterized protein n=1 Tax=Nephila pilipes TaxID=299642 RepID=A0A8X6QF82_NEPPI|nr:hypothetical protein NPIL_601141 [Nephila pilipes]
MDASSWLMEKKEFINLAKIYSLLLHDRWQQESKVIVLRVEGLCVTYYVGNLQNQGTMVVLIRAYPDHQISLGGDYQAADAAALALVGVSPLLIIRPNVHPLVKSC